MKAGILHRSCLVAGAAVIVAAMAGCDALLGGARVNDRTAGAPRWITQYVAPSMLVAVAGPGDTGRSIRQVVTATARPREDLDVLQADERGQAVIAASFPAPAGVKLPGAPASPGPGASSYQWAQYRKALSRWHAERAADVRLVAARTKAATMAWVNRLPWARLPAGPAVSPAHGSLQSECAMASNAVSGLVAQAGRQFGTGRVLLLAVTNLDGMPPAGELDGDDVIVTTSSLPTSAATSAAQASLLAAGAAHAAIVGTEVTAAQVDQLVAEGLGQQAVTEKLSGRALFANNSSVLLRSAAAVLTPLVPLLRRPGAAGVVNGYASTPGSAAHNESLSQRRAAAVARFLEDRGVPAARLLVIGHGAADLIAPGTSGDNRRVVVVIEEPTVSPPSQR